MQSCQDGRENCKPKCKPTTRHAVASDNTNQDSNSSSALTRRCALAGAGAVLAATVFPFASSGAAPQAANTPKAMSPAEALDRLVQGNARYAAGEGKARDFSPSAAAAAEGLTPIAAVLAWFRQPCAHGTHLRSGPRRAARGWKCRQCRYFNRACEPGICRHLSRRFAAHGPRSFQLPGGRHRLPGPSPASICWPVPTGKV